MKTQITQWLAKSARPTPPIINSYHRSTTCPRVCSKPSNGGEQCSCLLGIKSSCYGWHHHTLQNQRTLTERAQSNVSCWDIFKRGLITTLSINTLHQFWPLSQLSGKYWLCHVYDIGPSQLIGPFRQNSENTSNEVTYSMESFLINLNIG